MTVAKPQNREEFREHILIRLGKPVLEVNVSEEQIDIAIDDAFQYFHERQHFDGTEKVYLTCQWTGDFIRKWTSYKINPVDQYASGSAGVCAEGAVQELIMVNPGSGYPGPQPKGGEPLFSTTTGGDGRGLTVVAGSDRTTDCGIITVVPYTKGSGYKVGDEVMISGGSGAVFEVTKLASQGQSTPGTTQIRTQNNYIILPDDVIGVTEVLRPRSTDGGFIGGGIGGGGIGTPPLWGGGIPGLSGECDDNGFGFARYYAFQSFLSTVEFILYPPKQWHFNLPTHRLFIDSDLNREVGPGGMLCFFCDVKPNPDMFPDLWNDLWLKEMAYALTKAQWGRNLTKYNQVQLPGGLTMNGDRILSDAQEELQTIKSRFAMDWADPPRDLVG